jgi:hypothetical protein
MFFVAFIVFMALIAGTVGMFLQYQFYLALARPTERAQFERSCKKIFHWCLALLVGVPVLIVALAVILDYVF